MRPEWYNLAWSLRYTYPSYFVLKNLVPTPLSVDQAAQILVWQGWEPTLAQDTAQSFAGSSSSTGYAPVYGTLCVGRQSLAKAWSMVDGNTEQPHVVPGPITDFLRRFVPWGWYWLGGYGRFREAAIRRFEGASSIGLNLAAGTN